MAEAPTQGTVPLLHAYKLQDYNVEPWLAALWQSKLNSDFKTMVNEAPIMIKLKEYFGRQYSEWQSQVAEEQKAQEDAGEENKDDEKNSSRGKVTDEA